MRSLALTLLSIVVATFPCYGETSVSSQGCRNHIGDVERQKGIPEGLLEAIAHIESKLNPFIVNAGGKAHFFSSSQAAADFVREKQKQGYKNISVGPMQLHVPSHKHKFKSLEDMLDPKQNIAYAGSLLKRLEKQHGSSEAAVRYYHSADPTANRRYKDRVFGAWAKIRSQRKLTPIAHSDKGKGTNPLKNTAPKVKSKPKIKFNYGLRKKTQHP